MKTWKKIGAALFAIVILLSSFKTEPAYAISPAPFVPNGQTSVMGGSTVKKADNPASMSCTWSSFTLEGCVSNFVQTVFLKGSAWVLWASALLFDSTLNFTLNFKNVVGNVPIVNIGWGLIRDICNIFFIFLLLITSIGIIVGSSKFGSKSMVASVLTAALLINFSLFFTQIIIDASNITALQFYGQMRGDPNTTPGSKDINPGIASAYMNALDLTTIFNQGSNNSPVSLSNILIISIGGGILILITAFVFFAATIMFIYRSVILVVLLTTSPIAFMGAALPGSALKKQASNWWGHLTKQAVFPPVYMAMTYIILKALVGSPGSVSRGGFEALFKGDANSIGIAFSFLMIIGFMVVTLVMSVSAGGAGSSIVFGAQKRLAGWGRSALRGARNGLIYTPTRRIIGGTAAKVADSNVLRRMVNNNGLFGGAIRTFGKTTLAASNAAAASKFGLSRNFGQVVKDKAAAEEKMFKFATGSQTTLPQGRFESKEDYAARVAEDKKFEGKAEERKDAFVKRLENPSIFDTETKRQGNAIALKSRTISKWKEPKQIEEQQAAIKLSRLEAIQSLTGIGVIDAATGVEHKLSPETIKDLDLKGLDLEDIKAMRKAHEKQVELAKDTKDYNKLQDGDLKNILKEIKGVEDKLGSIKFGKVGERQVLGVQLATLNTRRSAIEAKIDTHFDKAEQDVLKKAESTTDKKLDELKEAFKK